MLIPCWFFTALPYDDFRHDDRIRHNNLLAIVGAKRGRPHIYELDPAGGRSHGDLVTPT